MKTLLIDNYDSFTFNLFQLLAEVNSVPPLVVRNDRASWSELSELDFDNVVISPGPGRPEVERDFGACREAILMSDVPVLGVCLGHQGLCQLFGGKVDYATEVMHGRASDINHAGVDIFDGVPSPFSAIRYHSLLVSELPDDLERIAWTSDEIVMGVRHKSRPIWGVQFHPESICSEYGRQILENFRSLTTTHLKTHPPRRRASDGCRPKRCSRTYSIVPERERFGCGENGRGILHDRSFKVLYRRIPSHVDTDQAFMNLFSTSEHAFWLDSALVKGFSRFSYMGDTSGPHAEYLSYDVNKQQIRVEHRGKKRIFEENIFSYLERMLQERNVKTEGLPFDFNCGYAGYLGYELKADCGADRAHESDVPDAAFVFADRLIAFDHEEEMVYLVCIEHDEQLDRAQEWMDETQDRLLSLDQMSEVFRRTDSRPVTPRFRHPPQKYLELIRSCQDEIDRGESYEVCLTNMLHLDVEVDPLNTYRALRAANPAPYATYLNFPEVSVLSSSPERFLTIDPCGNVEAKPIKGTRKRGDNWREDEELYQELMSSEKDRSENLMIVDLLRNDIGSVAAPGSVHVSSMFAVESYETVHQLVSTVRGRLRQGISGLQCVQAAFPGGSMTGAPKKRTMEIIDRLEEGARGIYSGSIGFFGLNGSVDLSIVIRTIVVSPAGVTVGAGGAIVALSDPQAELEEMILKSKVAVEVVSETALAGLKLADTG